MKIIHILAGKANPNTMNGVNNVVHSIAEEQTKNGHNVSVLGVANNAIIRHQFTYELKLFVKNKSVIFPPKKLISEIRNLGKDAKIHIHSAYIPWYPVLVLYLKFSGRKYVLTPHGAYTPNNFKNNFLKILYFILVESIILFFANKIQVIGKSEINAYTKSFIAAKAIYIPNGCIPKRHNHFNKSDMLIFGYMGRLKIDIKGLDLLFDGFSSYIRNKGKGRLMLAGDGPDKEKLMKLAKYYNISNRIDFTGVLFGYDKEKFLTEISFFIHTSRWEGFPIGCVEALSFNTPLLVSKETNLEELVTTFCCGLVLKTNVPHEIEKSLFDLQDIFYGDNYSSFIDGTRKIVKEKLSWQNINTQIEFTLYA